MDPGLRAQQDELWAQLAPWPLLLAAHCSTAIFDGKPSSAGPPVVTPETIAKLSHATLHEAAIANRAGLGDLRLVQRRILLYIEHGGDAGALLLIAMCNLNASLARILEDGAVIAHTVSPHHGGAMALPWVDAFLSFAMTRHVRIHPPLPIPTICFNSRTVWY
jgi:hypothetical protein